MVGVPCSLLAPARGSGGVSRGGAGEDGRSGHPRQAGALKDAPRAVRPLIPTPRAGVSTKPPAVWGNLSLSSTALPALGGGKVMPAIWSDFPYFLSPLLFAAELHPAFLCSFGLS